MLHTCEAIEEGVLKHSELPDLLREAPKEESRDGGINSGAPGFSAIPEDLRSNALAEAFEEPVDSDRCWTASDTRFVPDEVGGLL